MTTSFSVAPLQMGRDCDRQKARLHWLQDGLVCVCARRLLRVRKRCWGDWGLRSESGVLPPSGWVSSRRGVPPLLLLSEGGTSGVVEGVVVEVVVSTCPVVVEEEDESEPGPSSLWEGGVPPPPPPVVDLDLISMMVLLLKQVHLQNVGAAVE